MEKPKSHFGCERKMGQEAHFFEVIEVALKRLSMTRGGIAMQKGLITSLIGVTLLLGGCFTGTKQGIGTATGGALGGLVGSQIGSGSGQLAATAAGAIAGALIGSSVGQSMDDQDRMKAAQALESSRTGYSTSWQNPDNGAQYTMTPTRTYETANGYCRDFSTQVNVDGRAETVYGTACRQPDGTWKAVN